MALHSVSPDLLVPILTQPEDWALQHPSQHDQHRTAVPILTQPEDWALLQCALQADIKARVPILTQPEDWALRAGAGVGLGCGVSSNPHPARRLGATANMLNDLARLHPVPILTQPEDWALRLAYQTLVGRASEAL